LSRCDIAETTASVCETHPSRSEGGQIHARRGEERHGEPWNGLGGRVCG
jgi:hypothetical protein